MTIHAPCDDLFFTHTLGLRARWQEEGAPRLVMGKMQLEGHVVQLKKPLAIMTLRKPDESSTEYHVAGTVRQKLVFKTRQVPVPVAKAAPAAPSLCGTKRTRAAEGPQASPQGAQPAEATVS